jgi:methionyl-tRNA formyltransferase
MGTPDFAVASLQKLVENGCNVVAVITAPDKPSGRGQVLSESPVKKYAVSQNIPVLQPEKLKNVDFLAKLANFQADLQVVVAFRMLPEVVWAMPPKGTFNLHGSLLPDYRGAAPINWAVINGEKETGVTTFFIEKEIDTGKIIFSEKTPIFPEDNAGTLHDRLMLIGADLVLKTVRAIEANDYPQIPQNE